MSNSQPTSNEHEEQEQAPERLWVELRTQHAFTIQPEPYVETVAYMPVDLFNVQYEGLMRAALLREQNAATAMRDKCVEKAREMIDKWDQEARTAKPEVNHRVYVNYSDAAWEIISALQSLTLDQVEMKR